MNHHATMGKEVFNEDPPKYCSVVGDGLVSKPKEIVSDNSIFSTIFWNLPNLEPRSNKHGDEKWGGKMLKVLEFSQYRDVLYESSCYNGSVIGDGLVCKPKEIVSDKSIFSQLFSSSGTRKIL